MANQRLLAVASLALTLSTLSFTSLGCNGTTPGSGGNGAGPGNDSNTPSTSLSIASPAFTLHPGEELFKCFYTTLANDTDLQAVRIHSTMSPGSHHFIVYTTQDPLRPDGTFEDCSARQSTSLQDTPVWLYSTQDPEAELDMPTGTALPLKAHQPIYLDMHYINATPSDMTVQVKLDLDGATGQFQKVGAFITYNTQISIPPGGTQTVSGDCDLPAGANFFVMSTHSHKRTVEAKAVRRTNGVDADVLVDTTDWEHATIGRWSSPFLTFGPNDQLHYECSYKNDTANTIKEGESAEKNEMCMAVGYYFPASGDTFCLNSTIYSF